MTTTLGDGETRREACERAQSERLVLASLNLAASPGFSRRAGVRGRAGGCIWLGAPGWPGSKERPDGSSRGKSTLAAQQGLVQRRRLDDGHVHPGPLTSSWVCSCAGALGGAGPKDGGFSCKLLLWVWHKSRMLLGRATAVLPQLGGRCADVALMGSLRMLLCPDGTSLQGCVRGFPKPRTKGSSASASSGGCTAACGTAQALPRLSVRAAVFRMLSCFRFRGCLHADEGPVPPRHAADLA